MCRVLAITNVKKIKIDKKLINAIKIVTTEDNPHGFGYAVMNDDGEVWGERSIKPESFTPLEGDTKTKHCPIVSKTTNSFGAVGMGTPKSLIGHGRFSTNTISLANTHPYVDNKTALIHNGVVSDPESIVEGLCSTNNDTEILLRHWQLGGIGNIEKYVTGYYACAIFDDGILTVLRDSTAPLYLCFVKSIDSFIIATKAEMILKLCQIMKWKNHDTPEIILNNCLSKFDGNNIIDYVIFSPRKDHNIYAVRNASKAFGGYDEYTNYYERDYDDTPPLSYKEMIEKAEKSEEEITEKDVYELIEKNENLKRSRYGY